MRQTRLDKNMLATIFTLAWPTMLEELMQTAVQYIDTAMVGTLGTQATAAVGATGTVSWLVSSVASAFGVGFLAYISQAFGAQEQDRARKASAQAVSTAVVLGLVLTFLTVGLADKIVQWMQVEASIRSAAAMYFRILYLPMLFRTFSILFGTVLRAVGDTRSPMLVGLKVNLINIVLNFLLIYPTRSLTLFSVEITVWGAGWGINGAAAASAVAYTYGGITMLGKLWKHRDISPAGQGFHWDLPVLRACFRVAFPNMLQRFATSLGYVAFASMINALGEIPAATHTIANTVESLFYIPGWGMQTAAATLAGNALGARDEKKLKSFAGTFLPLEIALMVCSGGLLFLFAPQLMALFSKDDRVLALGTTILRMVAISEPFYGVPIVLEGLMLGTGRTVAPFVFNVLGMWCVRILGTAICTRFLGLGLVAAWGCMIGHNLLLFVLFSAYYASGRALPGVQKAELDLQE